MGRIYIVIGKSAAGKDSVYAGIMKKALPGTEPLVIYTTRPKRNGEQNGREYYFTDEAHMRELEAAGRIIEKRVYPTVHGDWYYFTADEGQIKEDASYVGIGTLESFVRLKSYFGDGRVCPLYIECDNKTRLLRSVERESMQAEPSYAEVCRRYLADEEDFSEEKIRDAGIEIRFRNDETVDKCVEAVIDYIRRLEGVDHDGKRL